MALRRGSARSLDHAQLVHEQWLQAAKLGLQIFVLRVATNDNIADLPSRQVPNVSLFVFPFENVRTGIYNFEDHGGSRERAKY